MGHFRRAGPLLVLALAVVAASFPAWTGGYVYDDWHMRGNPAMDELSDLAQAFRRTSRDYFDLEDHQSVTGSTYRPLSHVSLIAVQATAGDAALVHHLVSLALHLVSIAMLHAALRARTQPALALGLTGLFALHPLTIEAYGWINGRSDVLAGAALATTAWWIRRRASLLAFAVVAACALVASLAKETAMLAVLALLLAHASPERAPVRSGDVKAGMPWIGAGFVGLACALVLRASLVGLREVGIAAFRAEHGMAGKLVRMLGEALASVFVPVPRTMATLAWELADPVPLSQWVLITLAASVLLWLLLRGLYRAALLFLGAAATLAPTVVVSSAFWSGFDRYLYMPAILGCLAVGAIPALRRNLVLERKTVRAAGLVLASLLAASSFETAGSYESQSTFMASMLRLRPEDPSGYLLGAAWLSRAGHVEQAARLLDEVPPRGLPQALSSALVTRLAEVGRIEAALEVLEDMARRYPDDPHAIYSVIAVSLKRGEVARGIALAERLRDQPGFCEGVHALLRDAERRMPQARSSIESFRDGFTCR